MPVTLQELETLIREEFPQSTPELAEELNRITGTIRWEEFRPMDISDRNSLVTKRVRDKLGLRGMNVGILYPLAPGEAL
jgi:hypothetical protein